MFLNVGFSCVVNGLRLLWLQLLHEKCFYVDLAFLGLEIEFPIVLKEQFVQKYNGWQHGRYWPDTWVAGWLWVGNCKIVTISVGIEAVELTLFNWNIVRREIHFSGGSEPRVPWQNYCWVITNVSV